MSSYYFVGQTITGNSGVPVTGSTGTFTGAVTAASFTATGSSTAANFTISPATGKLNWLAQAQLKSPSDGVVQVLDSAGTDTTGTTGFLIGLNTNGGGFRITSQSGVASRAAFRTGDNSAQASVLMLNAILPAGGTVGDINSNGLTFTSSAVSTFNTTVAVPAGTGALPGISVGGTADGMFQVASGVVGFGGAGTEVARHSATLFQVPAAVVMSWNGRAQLTSPADGQVQILSAGGGTGANLIVGNTSGAGITLTHSGNTALFQGSPGGSYINVFASTFAAQQGGTLSAATTTGATTTVATTTAATGILAGATTTLSALIPAGSVVIGVSCRVTSLVTSGTGTSFTIGDGTNAIAFGTGIAFAANTTTTTANWTLTSAPVYAAATNIVFTCTGGTFTGGTIRCTVSYISASAPTS